MATYPSYGTLTTFDTLASTQQNIAEFGEDRAWDAITAQLVAHNEIMDMIIGDLCDMTTDRLRRFGSPAQMKMVEIDEVGTPDTQKIQAGVAVGFPLKLYGASLQWTRKYFQRATGSEIAAQTEAAQDADVRNVIYQLKKAIFTPTNYSFTDRLVDHLETSGILLPVKALVNADSLAIPIGPNGEIFDASTHTHYLASATLTTTALNGLIDTVIEHYNDGSPLVYINRAQEDTIRALTGFVPYVDGRIIPNTQDDVGMKNLDTMRIYNRAIGIYRGAEIWVKPWMPSGYLFAYIKGQGKPLVYRHMPDGGSLEVTSEDENHPLRAKTIEREFGIGVWNRTNGAVLYIGGGSYVTPSYSTLGGQ